MDDRPDTELIPEDPADVGTPRPRLRIEDVEGARLLDNQVRARLVRDGFTESEALHWVDAYFARFHEGEVDDVVAWIHAQQQEQRGR